MADKVEEEETEEYWRSHPGNRIHEDVEVRYIHVPPAEAPAPKVKVKKVSGKDAKQTDPAPA